MDSHDPYTARGRRLQEQQDHEFALRLAGFDIASSGDGVEFQADELLARDLHESEIEDLLELTRSLHMDESEQNDHSSSDEQANIESAALVEDQPGDTDASVAAQGKAPKSCIACHDKSGTIAVPCEHRYCAECLTEVLRIAMIDGTAFPPRCCRQEIPITDIRQHLDRGFVQEFEKKAVELGSQNQVYCYEPACSTFIPTDEIKGADSAQCPKCFRWTCMHCKGGDHDGECPEDEGVQQLLQTAGQEGWRRCECGRMIELDYGCNHMTASPPIKA